MHNPTVWLTNVVASGRRLNYVGTATFGAVGGFRRRWLFLRWTYGCRLPWGLGRRSTYAVGPGQFLVTPYPIGQSRSTTALHFRELIRQ